MSGGVDSSVAAALLQEGGYQVFGVTMQLWPSQGSGDCDTVSAAGRVAGQLGIPHYVTDFRDTFAEKVIDDFCREYGVGRTPNPCIRCNGYIKFGALLEKAIDLGADVLATGHYVRVERDGVEGQHLLRKGIDRGKDQSYVLCMLRQDQLRRTLMPLGDLTKEQVIRIAHERGLSGGHKGESQEICFIPDGDYGNFVFGKMPHAVRPGPIMDRSNNVIGEHRGVPFYTVGQRRGLGISSGEPLYVCKIDSAQNAIIVGSKADIYNDELTAADVNWASGDVPEQPLDVKAKIRYRHCEADAVVTPLSGGDMAHVKFRRPQMAITPGQAVVFYDGDTVVGGGTIDQVTGV